MATALALVVDETDIIATVQRDHSAVLFDETKFEAWVRAKRDAAPTDLDMTRPKDRDQLRSYAADLRTERAAIKKDRLKLTEEWRALTSKVNDAGKKIDADIEALIDEVRQPLTLWETAEETRVAECRSVIADLRGAATVTIEDTAATVRERGTRIWEIAIDPARFGDMAAEAEAVKEATIATLRAAMARLAKEEADRAELERLRAEAAERDRIEVERRETEQAEARRQEEARRVEERRVAAERAEAERIAAAERAAEERARAEAERQHAEELAAERRRAEEAERAAAAERERTARAERERAQEADRIAVEQRKREADTAHRNRVKTAAKQALMTCGVDEDAARKIVLAVIAGEIPHLRLEF